MENETTTLGMMLGELSGIREVERRVREIFADNQKIAWHGSKLGPIREPEKVVGTCESDILRALYVVNIETEGESRMHIAQSHMASNDTDQAELGEKGRRLDLLNDLARDIFWAQLKLDILIPEAESSMNVGLREEWKVVVFPRGNSAEISMIAGPFGIPRQGR